MALASLLFVAGGLLDRGELGVAAYALGVTSAVFTIVVASGSERGLLARIVLAAAFFGSALLLALAPGELGEASAVYLLTALVEVTILLNALRVWRAGRSVDARDLNAIFALVDEARAERAPEAPVEVRREAALERAAPLAVAEPKTALAKPAPVASAGLPRRIGRLIGLFSVALVLALIVDGVLAGFVPGGLEWELYGPASGWLTYVFAVVVAAVAAQALAGSRLSLRLLQLVSLVLFVERPFSPFVLGQLDPNTLASHLTAAVLALALAIAATAGLRATDRARGAIVGPAAGSERQAAS